ncbi:hypothetical protein [Corallococcus terminator]|uniref:Outer membrane protein beta-barrel domain-containing protein n=1 Tax=Corallococcus terminator TaxID=2316733 RepID=A0A3A8HBT4_9BACT|nr:hypothetical protein [Corallococcus terminator]RKG68607.1 hypothetical protein D7V88_40600 [Corallococcus terminator]
MRASSLLPLLLLLPTVALADRGAFTVEAGGGVSVPFLYAPYASDSPAVRTTAASIWVGTRYALTNHLEFAASGFYEPGVTVFHNAVTVVRDGAPFPGTLRHDVSRMGALAGAHLVWGLEWRFIAGLEAGWSARSYSAFQHIDTSQMPAVDYGLQLADFTAHNFVLVPAVGVEWAKGDHWSIALVPRLQVLLGKESTVALTVPLTLSWSWYL